MLRITAAVHRTDVGRQREANEDSFFSRAPVFAVADGMGGAQAGEIASSIAVEAFEPEPERIEEIGPEEYLRATVRTANRRIFDHAQGDSNLSGMGTTLTAALVLGDEVSFAHVGDSRAYLYRDGELSQLTHDHSLVEELRRQGKLTRDQAAEHPQRSVITRALGPEADVAVDTMTVRGREGDVFLLCSDGLTTMLADEDVAAILARSDDLDVAARRLVRAANAKGGKDNITVVLFAVSAADAEVPEEGATLIGPSAEDEGFTADAVREGVAAQRASATTSRDAPPRDRAVAVPSGHGRSRSGWGRRLLRVGIALLVLAVLATGAVLGARQVWFLGVDEGNRVALYRGLPYELLGVELYSESFSSPVTIEALPEDRREAATDHELRSHDDAVSLIEDLENAAAEQAAAEQEATEPPTGPGPGSGQAGDGAGNDPAGGGNPSGGGDAQAGGGNG
jgi:serine/threonine protein phosphatase PrpC